MADAVRLWSGWVILGEVGSGVCDFEAAVGGGGEFDEVAGVGAG